MVGLGIVLENQKTTSFTTEKPSHVVNKTTLLATKSCPPTVCRNSSLKNFAIPAAFLDHCFLCRQKLLPGNDIYMYKGDRAFCSVECRCRQIFMDEEESAKSGNCSFAAAAAELPSSSSSSESSASRHGKKRASGFAC